MSSLRLIDELNQKLDQIEALIGTLSMINREVVHLVWSKRHEQKPI